MSFYALSQNIFSEPDDKKKWPYSMATPVKRWCNWKEAILERSTVSSYPQSVKQVSAETDHILSWYGEPGGVFFCECVKLLLTIWI